MGLPTYGFVCVSVYGKFMGLSEPYVSIVYGMIGIRISDLNFRRVSGCGLRLPVGFRV